MAARMWVAIVDDIAAHTQEVELSPTQGYVQPLLVYRERGLLWKRDQQRVDGVMTRQPADPIGRSWTLNSRVVDVLVDVFMQ